MAAGVLVQSFGNAYHPVTYFTSVLDSAATGGLPHLRAVVAIGEKSHYTVLGHPLTVAIPYAVLVLLEQGKTQQLSFTHLTQNKKQF